VFKKLFLVSLSLLSLHASSITIAVAANVSYAIKPLVQAFENEHKEIKVKTVLGSSGKLTAQIMHSAPYTLFMSADLAYPQKLYAKGFAQKPPVIYAKGKLVLLSKKPRNFSKGLDLLLEKKIKKIAVANPKTAPYGRATQEALKSVGLYEKLHSKFIYGESIGQTFIYTMRATDIGIVAKSLLSSPKLAYFQKGKNYIDIDTKLYTPISQGVVVLKKADKNTKLFYNFLFSKEAKEIFEHYGYGVGE
jgi:molybdate transport system substrate-binding protein